MAAEGPFENLDIATLPLADGRQLMVPLGVLAEVQQVNFVGRPEEDLGELAWRGYELPITSLDSLVGLAEPAPERLNTVGVFKADKDSDPPFKALAFTGIASPGRVEPSWLQPVDTPLDDHFVGAALMQGHTYLIPDLRKLLFAAG